MARVALVREQIALARNYTLRLLDHTDPADWYRQPREGVTHVAWQVGHLALAEYRLALERVRGQRPEDDAFLLDPFIARFGRDSLPNPDPCANPSPAQIRSVFDRVHWQVLRELDDLTEGVLDEPTRKPHPLFNTKLGSLVWCAQHEMLHAGQIGLLRRLLGYRPLW